MITETPPVVETLDELREELNGERIDMGELVVLGAGRSWRDSAPGNARTPSADMNWLRQSATER